MEPGLRQTLGILLVLSALAGYQGTIITSALTFAADSWHQSTGAQSRALAILRADIFGALFVMRLADHIGRRKSLLVVAAIAPLLSALSGLSTNLNMLTALQLPARASTTALASLIAVYVAETVPVSWRARVSAALVGAAAIGSGCTLATAAAADASPDAWRLIFVPPLLGLFALVPARKILKETRSFTETKQAGAHATRKQRSTANWQLLRTHRTRLLLIGLFTALVAIETTPTRQLQNQFLRHERGFSALSVTLFGIATNAPGLLGLLLGGPLGDRKGRRFVMRVGLFGFAVFDALLFLTDGKTEWIVSVFGAAIGGMLLPAMAIYPAELFPTEIRATADGWAVFTGRAGGVVGLLLVGLFSTEGHTGVVLAATTAGLWLAMALLKFLPEPLLHPLPLAADIPRSVPLDFTQSHLAQPDFTRTDPARTDPARTDPARTDPARTDPAPTEIWPDDLPQDDSPPTGVSQKEAAP
jgi:MFS family permease